MPSPNLKIAYLNRQAATCLGVLLHQISLRCREGKNCCLEGEFRRLPEKG